MLRSPCPRCGEPGGDGLCGRCTAYLLRFDPFVLRPGLPGPSVDRETRRGVALLTLDPKAPLAFAAARARAEDDAFALQFLNHVGLPDGGFAVLTRGDREVLQRLLRRWARSPPKTKDARSRAAAVYREASSLPEMPPSASAIFRELAGGPEPPVPEPEEPSAEPPAEEFLPVAAETPPPIPPPEPTPAPEPEPEPEPEEREAPAPPLLPPPPPPDLGDQIRRELETAVQKERVALETLKADLVGRKEELARWADERHQEMDRRAGIVESRAEELRQRESAIAEKEHAIAAEEERLREKASDVQRRAAEAGAAEAKRSLFFLLFSMPDIDRSTAKALSDAFGTEERLRTAPFDQIASVPGVRPEQAALVRDAFAAGAAPKRRDLREKAEEMLEEGRNAEALEVFEELVRLNPEDGDAWMNRGEMLQLLGRVDDAIASYERALALDSDHRGARSELANLLFEAGDYGLAAANLQELLKQAPEHKDLWLTRATALLSQGKATEATLVYNAVLEADPANLIASLALGDLLLAMGDVSTAEREYTRALQHHPDSPEALLKKALLLDRQGRWGAAVQLLNRAVSLRWNYREAWEAKGQILLSQGKPKEALECFDKLLAFDGSLDEAWLGKAEAHFALGENDKAAEAAGRALALNKGNQDIHDLLERLREGTDRPKESVDVAELTAEPSFDAKVLIEVGDTLLESGDAEAALRAYNEVLARDAKAAAAWFGKGRALHALARWGEAVRCFTAAAELEPANEEYRRWLSVAEDRWRKEDG